jgi:low temperature requirement protein LtrA
LAIVTYGFTLFAALGGIIVLATGIKFAIAHHDEAASAATAWFLAGGVAAYIVGFVVFRRVLAIGPILTRLGIAAGAPATAAVGLGVTAEAQLGALVVVLFGGLSIETATRRPDATRRSSHQ